jgi:hypothetical protein
LYRYTAVRLTCKAWRDVYPKLRNIKIRASNGYDEVAVGLYKLTHSARKRLVSTLEPIK